MGLAFVHVVRHQRALGSHGAIVLFEKVNTMSTKQQSKARCIRALGP